MFVPDPKLDTMELLYPDRKPVKKVKIDWTNPLTEGLVSCWVIQASETGRLIDLCGNENMAIRPNSYVDAQGLFVDGVPNGEALTGAEASSSGGVLDFTGPFTFISKIKSRIQSESNSFRCIISKRGNAAGYQYQFRIVTGNALSLLTTGGSNTSSITVPVGENTTVGVAYNQAGSTIFMGDGGFDEFASKSISSKAIPAVMGSTFDTLGGVNQIAFDGVIYWMMAFNIALSQEKMSLVRLNVNKMIIPA